MEFVDQTYIDLNRFNEVTVQEQEEKQEVDDPCPICGKKIYRSGRCKTCLCGWSSCDL